MVQTGQHVKLYAYNHIDGVPSGVEICDAEAILPLSILYKIDPTFPNFQPSRSIVQFSDIFRIMLMKHQQDVWLASDNASRIGVSALYLLPP